MNLHHPIRLLLASDSDLRIHKLLTYLDALPEIQITKSVAHGIDTLEACRETHPEVAIVDLSSTPLPLSMLLTAIHHFVPTLHIIGWTAVYEANIDMLIKNTHMASYIIDRDLQHSLIEVLAVVMAGSFWYSHTFENT